MNDPRKEWSNPPVDDVGYLPVDGLLDRTDDELRELVSNMERARYSGWRNYRGQWRSVLGLDSTNDAVVLDYGCGVGVEALQYARAGNEVYVADIVPENVRLALRVLTLFGYPATGISLRRSDEIGFPDRVFDVIHCAGVLHHIPEPVPVVEEFHRILKEDGELRLMLYSDTAWSIATSGGRAPTDVKTDPNFQQYVRYWDAVGDYADWYDIERIVRRFGHCFHVKTYETLTEHGEYVGAVLVRA